MGHTPGSAIMPQPSIMMSATPCPARPYLGPDRSRSAHWWLSPRRGSLSPLPRQILHHGTKYKRRCQVRRELLKKKPHHPAFFRHPPHRLSRRELGTFPALVPHLRSGSAVPPAPLAGRTDRANVFATNSPHAGPSRQIGCGALSWLPSLNHWLAGLPASFRLFVFLFTAHV